MWPPPLYLEAQGSLFGDAAPFRGAAWCCALPGSSLSRRRVATWDLRGKHVAMAALPQSEYQLNPHPLPKVPRRTAVLFLLFISGSDQCFIGVRPLRRCAKAQMSRR